MEKNFVILSLCVVGVFTAETFRHGTGPLATKLLGNN